MDSAPNRDGLLEKQNTENNSPPSSNFYDTLEEADLYRVVGQTLYMLNTYKGFMVYDLSNPSALKKEATLPVFGVPVEMFIEGQHAFVLVRDALRLEKNNGTLSFQRKNVSQLVVLDLSHSHAPKVLQRIDIQGQLRAGVSRKSKTHLHIVAHITNSYQQAWPRQQGTAQERVTLYTFDIKTPTNPKQQQVLQLLEQARVDDADTGETPILEGVVLSTSQNHLLIGERWSLARKNNDATWSCQWRSKQQRTYVNVVSLGSDSALPSLQGRFRIEGDINDQFKQTLYKDGTNQLFYLGITQQKSWNVASCAFTSTQNNNFVSYSVSAQSASTLLKSQPFTTSGETIQASLFDKDAKRAFISTTNTTSGSLYVIDWSDPAAPSTEAVEEAFPLSAKVINKVSENRLLLVGESYSELCNKSSSSHVSGTAAGLILLDLSKDNFLQSLSERCATAAGSLDASRNVSLSKVDLDQAHKSISIHQDGAAHYITLPIEYQQAQDNYTEYRTAVSLFRWKETQAGGSAPSPLQQVSVLEHPRGTVKRTALFYLPTDEAQGAKRRHILTISDTHLSLFDVQDDTAPTRRSSIEIAPFIGALYRFGGYLVEQAHLGEGYEKFNEFRVRKVSSGDIADNEVLASFRVGALEQVLRFQNKLVLFHKLADDASRHEVQVYDLSNPQKPQKQTSLELTYNFSATYRFYCGSFEQSYLIDQEGAQIGRQWVPTKEGLVALIKDTDARFRLLFLDLRNDTPSIRTRGLKEDEEYLYLIRTTEGRFFLVSRVKLSTKTREKEVTTTYKYYAQLWVFQESKWDNGTKVNLPGRLIQAHIIGQEYRLLTYDHFAYSDNVRDVLRMHLLSWKQQEEKAAIVATTSFGGYGLQDILLQGQRLYINAHQRENNTSTNHLMIVDLVDDRFARRYEGDMGTENTRIVGVYQSKLFFDVAQEGILVVDVQTPNIPKGLHFQRTPGWTKHISFYGKYAFLSAGHFGIYTLDLETSTF